MDEVKSNRKQARSATTRFGNYMDKLLPDNVNCEQLEMRLEAYIPMLRLFTSLSLEDEEADDKEITEFENRYYSTITRARKLIDEIKGNALLVDSESCAASSSLSYNAKQHCIDLAQRSTEFAAFLDAQSVNLNRQLLKVRLDDYMPVLQLYKDAFNKGGATSEDMMKFQDEYFARVVKGKGMIEQNSPVHSCPPRDHSINLPPINMPKFSGDLKQWLSFKTTFESIVQDSAASNARKLKYLLTCLQGEALDTISTLAHTDANYDVAWQQLESRYNHPKLIIDAHLTTLLNINKVSASSASALRQFLNSFTKEYRSLSVLTDLSVDTIMIHLFTRNLDNATKEKWEEFRVNIENPTFEQQIKFIEERCQILCARSENENLQKPNFKPAPRGKPIQTAAPIQKLDETRCLFCNGKHHARQCEFYLNLPPDDRVRKIKENKLCFNCLSKHSFSTCQAGYCRSCGSKHHSSLHDGITNQPSTSKTSVNPPTAPVNISNSLSVEDVEHTLLSTALGVCSASSGQFLPVRIFLDNGSQPNLITLRVAKKLMLKVEPYDTPVIAANQGNMNIIGKVKCCINSRLSKFCLCTNFLVVRKIGQPLPTFYINQSSFTVPAGIELADPNFHTQSPIDVLIGSKHFLDILCDGRIKPSPDEPTYQNTHFGWIVGGGITSVRSANHMINSIVCSDDVDLHASLERFWRIEEVKSQRTLTSAELQCEEHFARTHYRQEDGRYVVQLPFKEDPTAALGDSKSHAIRRFLSLERRLQANQELRDDYTQFIKEYLLLGHMSLADPESENAPVFYLPHHHVLKPDSTTTKLRVVFDASAKSASGKSLNDILHVGPTLQQDLLQIVVRFRTHRFVLSGDLTKMYRQIRLSAEHSQLMRILWRDSPSEPIRDYKLQTVTYGTASASYLAIRCLLQLGMDTAESYPNAAKVVQNDFYVDDLLTGTNSVEEALQLRNDIRKLLASGGFEIRKWISNEPSLLENLGAQEILPIGKDQNAKPLGLNWSPTNDCLLYSVNSNVTSFACLTKRAVLSRIATIFDPLGLLGPVIATAKIFMQSLWLLGLTWDETIPSDIASKWLRFETELPCLQQIRIQRRIFDDSCNDSEWQIHGFCDASETAYGACLYAVSTNVDGSTTSHLICSKSRVAPVKKLSLPRLELCGAVLLVNLLNSVLDSVNQPKIKIKLFTDSMIVLCWIKSQRPWKTFVSNRISAILQDTSEADWHHISGKKNPADILSRGCYPSELQNHPLWWHSNDTEQEPINTICLNAEFSDEQLEVKVCAPIFEKTPNIMEELIDKISSMKRLRKAIGYVLRFKFNLLCRVYRTEPRQGPLSLAELYNAEELAVKTVQFKHFSTEITLLRQGKQVPKNSNILRLDPYVDSAGILRVGGRLQHSCLGEAHKHPAILPSKDHLTALIIERQHLQLLHGGSQLTLATLRRQYWPLLGLKTIKGTLTKCIVCFRASPKTLFPKMGNLPASRVQQARPFAHCGIDYAGPFVIKYGGPRSKITSKASASLFICMATKAVHIELVSDLTTQAFLSALNRFISRRGLVRKIYSDNATNFVGARNALREIFNSTAIQQGLEDLCIEWTTIPPRSPHFGGLWEAAVKAMKRHLTRVMGERQLTYEELSTLLIRIEAILNSRPLTPISNDAKDLACLTPAHFLIGQPLNAIPEADFDDLPQNNRNRWHLLNSMQQHFWKRWHKEYLHPMQCRIKWHIPTRPIQQGELVLLKDDLQPPLRWSMGRIEATHYGLDGICRVATVRTAKGTFKRALTTLCPFPLEEDF